MKRWHFVFCSISLTIRSRFVTLCSLKCGPNSDYCRLRLREPTENRHLNTRSMINDVCFVQYSGSKSFIFIRTSYLIIIRSMDLHDFYYRKLVNSVIRANVSFSACTNACTRHTCIHFVLRCSVCFIALLACGCLSVHPGSVRPERTPPARPLGEL